MFHLPVMIHENLILDCYTLLNFEQFAVYIHRNRNRMMVTGKHS